MTEASKYYSRKNTGQLLIVAAFAIALLISSTTMYVYELSRGTANTSESAVADFMFAVKQTARNVVTGSLANISNGGQKTVLASNMNRLIETLRSLRQHGICNLTYLALNSSNYDEGTRLSWGINGSGFSSAYASITVKIYDVSSQASMDSAINITSLLTLSGKYATLAGGKKNVSLMCTLTNEGQPAIAKGMTFFYDNGGVWTQVNASNGLTIIGLGNGTYIVSFITTVTTPVEVSVCMIDLRNVFIRANITCQATIDQSIKADLNGDGEVTIQDVVLGGSQYWLLPSDPEYNGTIVALADLAPPYDGFINILDMLTLVSHYADTG
jgi:hypothetical protein